MPSPSVSFRISRNTEDLAETIHALSQRLVRLEQRLAAMDLQIARRDESDPDELASLDNVERLLRDCRDLLDGAEGSASADQAPAPMSGAAEAQRILADAAEEQHPPEERHGRAA